VANSPNPGDRGRFSAKRKTAAVLRLLRGEDLELIWRELGVTAAALGGTTRNGRSSVTASGRRAKRESTPWQNRNPWIPGKSVVERMVGPVDHV
jgi:hypothetical protein